LAAFLVRLGEIGQALDVFAPVAAESKPELVNMLITELTRAPVVSSEELSRFDDLVQPFLEKLARPPALVLSLAKLCQQHGRFEEAERLYREVMRRDSGKLGAVSQNDLAYLFALRRQRADEALELVSSAEKVLGPLPALLDTRAMVYLALRKPQQALEELKKAIDQAPSATYYFHQAQAYLEAGNRPAAAAAAERAFREGLNAETLHPLERTAFEELQTLLAQVPAPLPSSAYQPQP
jgi:tetratricopeptide (TPR) repeat protein